MNKGQFIYRYGVPVTVTCGATSYQTRMFYHTSTRPIGTFNEKFFIGTDFMRDGIFRTTDNISDGCIVTINSSGEKMFVISHEPVYKFGEYQSIFAELIVLNFPIQVTITYSQANQNVSRDKFGDPTVASSSSTIGIIITKADTEIKSSVSGGKPIELLEFYTNISTVNENDEITWNGHTYRTTTVWPFGLATETQLLFCRATREVDL